MNQYFSPDEDEEEFEIDEYQGPSKSQLKRDSNALQDLGAELINLSKAQLARLTLPDSLLNALAEMQKIKANEARRRHVQYIGKLMRGLDEETVAEIQDLLDSLQHRHAQSIAQQHQLENWRQRLLEEGDAALGELLQEYPHADRQKLRQLMRKAQQAQTKDQGPKAFRELFRALRELSAKADS